MRSTSIWGVKSLDPWDQVHIFWGPKSLANHKSYFKDRWVLFNCRSLSTHSHTTANQYLSVLSLSLLFIRFLTLVVLSTRYASSTR